MNLLFPNTLYDANLEERFGYIVRRYFKKENNLKPTFFTAEVDQKFSNTKKVCKFGYMALKKYVETVYGCDVHMVPKLDQIGMLGCWDREDGEIFIDKNQGDRNKVLTLAHEIGHVMTYKAGRGEDCNEVLAELFAYLVVAALGFAPLDFPIFKKYKATLRYLKKYKKDIFSKVKEVWIWIEENCN